jgi:hypothetical protein
MPRFALASSKCNTGLKPVDGVLNLWFTLEITGPRDGLTYPLLVDLIDPTGAARRVPETFDIPFTTGRCLLDVKADVANVRPGNYALRLTIGGDQLDIPFSVAGGPSLKRMVVRAKVVDTGELLAAVMTPDDLYGDVGVVSFPDVLGPEPLSELEIAHRFVELYAEHDEGRTLKDCRKGDPFPDVVSIDSASGKPVTLELTQLAYEGRQTTQSHARRLKREVEWLLVSHRPAFRDRAMIIYFNRENGNPHLPNPQSKHGQAFLNELGAALSGAGFWEVHNTPPDDSGKSLRLETLNANPTLSVFHRYVSKLELGPNISTDPRLTSPDDPLVLLHSERVIKEGEFSRLVKRAVDRKLKKGTAYTADILLIHNAVDPHVLTAAEDDDVINLARQAVAETGVAQRFSEVWLIDIWEKSIFRLDNVPQSADGAPRA